MALVGVIGAGVMGRGVAQSLAQAQHDVFLLDISESILEKAREEVYNSLRFQGMFSSKSFSEDPKKVFERIIFSCDYELLHNVDYVIENVTEEWDVKKEIYKKIDDICKEDCLFMANTSCVSITQLAALTKRADKVIGTHFMNPVPMIAAVEVIRGYHTTDETVEATRKFIGSMNKECIVVNDYPGFVSNRISHLMMNEAAFIVQDQVAGPQEVDDIFKKCYGHKMGPLETADLIGLDTVVNSLDVLYESYGDPKFRCCPLLRKMVHAGMHGRKTGRGFYTY